MKILNLVFHPDLDTSRVNSTWKKILEESGKITTSRDMYGEYPGFEIDVEREQQCLLQHDRIIFQFPFYWYSVPPLLKKWLDDVLTYNFAYGSKGNKLEGKDMQLIVSVGGKQKFYSGFDIFSSVPDLLKPFQLTANLIQMNYLVPEWMFRADSAEFEKIIEFGNRLSRSIDDPGRSNPRGYLNSEMDSDADSDYQQVA